MRSQVAVVVPDGWAEIRSLQKTDRFTQKAVYDRSLARLLLRLGIFDAYQADDMVRFAVNQSELRIDHGLASLTLEWREPLGYYRTDAGPWSVEPHGRDLMFQLTPGSGSLKEPWQVQVNVDQGMPIASSSPAATHAGPGTRQWTLAKGAQVAALKVGTHPTGAVQERLFSTDWLNYLRESSDWLAGLLIPTAVLILVRRRIFDTRGSGPYASASVWARRLATASIAATAASFVVFTLGRGWLVAWIQHNSSAMHWYVGLTAVDLARVLVATAATIFILLRLARSRTRKTDIAGALLTLVVVASSLPLFSVYAPDGELGGIPRSKHVLNGLSISVVLILGTCVFLLAACGIRRAAREVDISAIGRDIAMQRPFGFAWTSHLRMPRLPRLRRFAGGLAAIALVLFYLVHQLREFHHYNRSSGRLSDVLRYVPLDLLGALSALLWLLLLLALLALLAATGLHSDSPLLERRHAAITAALALLLAGWSVGVASTIWGFTLPLPAIATAAAIAYFTRPHLESRRAAIAAANAHEGWDPSEFATEGFRREMIARARAIAATRRYKQSLYSRYRERELNEQSYDSGYDTADARENELLKGGAVMHDEATHASTEEPSILTRLRDKLQPPEPESVTIQAPLVFLPQGSPYSYALSLGPRTTWWQNGILAASFAAILALIPLGRYIYNYSSPSSGFAPLYVIRDFVSEWARWIVAGAVFGCCYAYLPGRVGAIKAIALVATIGATIGAFALVPTSHLPPRLPSNLLLLGLFLVVIGIFLDWLALRERRIDTRHLGDLYEMQMLRRAATLTPLLLGGLAISNSIAGGNWHDVGNLFNGLLDVVKSL
jgi:hypothetical protein